MGMNWRRTRTLQLSLEKEPLDGNEKQLFEYENPSGGIEVGVGRLVPDQPTQTTNKALLAM